MVDDIGLDINRASKAVEHYGRVAEVGISIIDTRGNILYKTEESGSGISCKFCQQVRQLVDTEDDYCKRVHLYGGYQSERFGGKYIFFCPMGMVHWASPISTKGMVRGYLLSGACFDGGA